MLKNGQKLVEEVHKYKRLKFDILLLTDESPKKKSSINSKSDVLSKI